MTWTELTWTADQGVQALVDGITAALTAHPAWEFVEEHVEKQIDGTTLETTMDFPLQIWKCLATKNSLHKDFYVAFSRMYTYAKNETGDTVTTDSGSFLMWGAEKYDVSNHWALNQVGKIGNFSESFTFNSDGTRGLQDINGYYPFVENRINSDGTTEGNWTDPNFGPINPSGVQADTVHPFSFTNGPYFSFPSFELTSTTKPTDELRAWIRVTKDGLLVMARDLFGEINFVGGAVYVGLMDQSAVPDTLKSDFPLAAFGIPRGWSWATNQSQWFMSRHPWSELDPINPQSMLGTPNISMFGYKDDMGATTDREQFPFDHKAEYPVVPWGLVFGQSSGLYQYGNYGLGAYIKVPGLYCISTNGAPESWKTEEVTAISPEGGACQVLYIYSDSMWFAIDKDVV